MPSQISVVIPTHNRPSYLPRAVTSALSCYGDDLEVIVVPNGSDSSWEESLAPWRSDSRVRVSAIPTAHANIARNHGLALATGKFIRFLDDDDYLLPSAKEQLDLLVASERRISCGGIDIVDAAGRTVRIAPPPETTDLVLNALSSLRCNGLQHFVYRTSAIRGFQFDANVDVGQDMEWTHGICRDQDWDLHLYAGSVCAWQQHQQGQISTTIDRAAHLRLRERILWETIVSLKTNGRMNEQRRAAAADGLWELVHQGFFHEPLFWLDCMLRVRRAFPSTYPPLEMYESNWGKLIHPAIIETAMLPKRRWNHWSRERKIRNGSRTFWG